jgi:ArsR family transcriptional regulator
MINELQISRLVDFHKALGNSIRLQIVDFLIEGEQCQCDIFPKFGLAQSTGSAYLTKLVKAGVLNIRKDGTRKLYSVAKPEIKEILDLICSVLE